MSNNEELLMALLGVSSLDNFVPRTRNEKILMNCITKSGTAGLEQPQSRIEALLQELAEELSGENPSVCAVTISVSPSGVADEYTLYDDEWGFIGNGLVHSLGVGSYIMEIHATGYGNASGYSSINFTITQSDITAGSKTVSVTLVPRYQTVTGEFIHITDALNRSATLAANADCNVIVCGKNLFDKTTATDNKAISDSGELYDSTSKFTSPFYNIKGTSYIKFSGYESNSNSWCAFYDADKTFISLVGSFRYSDTAVPENTVFMRFSAPLTAKDTVQFEIGNTETDYEAYSGQTLALASGVAQSVTLAAGINNIVSDNAEATLTLVY